MIGEFKELTWILFTAVISLLVYWFWKMNQKNKYWENKGVAHIKPTFWDTLDVLLSKKSSNEIYKELYFKFPNEKLVGLYEFNRPVMVLRDPKTIEKILVKDFQYFIDHTPYFDDESLMTKGLFQLTGSTWRALRYKISPAFTSGKLKSMFNGMVDCTPIMINKMNENLYKDYEVKDALSDYAIDVIANTVFGIELNNKTARKEFSKYGTDIFNMSLSKYIGQIFLVLAPELAKLCGIGFISKECNDYFEKFIKNTFQQRINSKQYRNDYLQLLLKLKEKGTIELQTKDDDEDKYLELDGKAPKENIELTEDLLCGQAFQFLTAGFEPLYNTIIFAMFALSRFPETQERARQEVKEVLKNHGGYTYDSLKDMTYLEQCIQETLRLHPLTPVIWRACTKNYKTEDGLEIEKGQQMIIPLQGIHMDPKYFPNPDLFDPERLPPGSVRNNFTYLPFGDGPRICIGLRFAIVVLKLGLAKILDNFKFTLSPNTKVPFEINKLAWIPIPTSKIFFNLSPA